MGNRVAPRRARAWPRPHAGERGSRPADLVLPAGRLARAMPLNTKHNFPEARLPSNPNRPRAHRSDRSGRRTRAARRTRHWFEFFVTMP